MRGGMVVVEGQDGDPVPLGGDDGGLGPRGDPCSLPLFLWMGSLYTFLPTCTVQ